MKPKLYKHPFTEKEDLAIEHKNKESDDHRIGKKLHNKRARREFRRQELQVDWQC